MGRGSQRRHGAGTTGVDYHTWAGTVLNLYLLPIGVFTLAVEPGRIHVAMVRPDAERDAIGQGRRTWGPSARQLFGYGLVAIFKSATMYPCCQRLALVARLPSAHGWWGGEMRGPDNCRVMLYLVDSMGAPAFQSVPVDVARSASGS